MNELCRYNLKRKLTEIQNTQNKCTYKNVKKQYNL